MENLDLVDEMNWEDCEKVEKISLEQAGLEEEVLDDQEGSSQRNKVFSNGIYSYTDWFYDGSVENGDY